MEDVLKFSKCNAWLPSPKDPKDPKGSFGTSDRIPRTPVASIVNSASNGTLFVLFLEVVELCSPGQLFSFIEKSGHDFRENKSHPLRGLPENYGRATVACRQEHTSCQPWIDHVADLQICAGGASPRWVVIRISSSLQATSGCVSTWGTLKNCRFPLVFLLTSPK